MSIPRVAVVGRGSAAARTLRVLRDLGNSGAVHVGSEPIAGFDNHHRTSLESLGKDDVDWVFDCSAASTRVSHARVLSERGLPTIFEKPLAMSADAGKLVLDLYAKQGIPVQVGYNLRRSQAFNFVRETLANSSLGVVRHATVSVGQYLPEWRPNRDYRSTVSAQARLGGGVLLELSHEINYAIGFWGHVHHVVGETSNSGELDIDAEDLAQGIFLFESRTEPVEVSVTLDFLRRTPERWCRIRAQKADLHWDLLKNEVVVSSSSDQRVYRFEDSLDDTHHHNISQMMRGGWTSPDSTKDNADALHTLEVIDAWRASSQSGGGVDVRRTPAHV